MTAQKQVVYPSSTGFSGSGQTNIGPFTAGPVKKLTQARLYGSMNFAGFALDPGSTLNNWLLYGVQWGAHGFTPGNIITSDYDTSWLIRHQAGRNDMNSTWAPSTDTGEVVDRYALRGWWAGQLYIGELIDYYLCLAPPTGVVVPDATLFGSIEIWFI